MCFEFKLNWMPMRTVFVGLLHFCSILCLFRDSQVRMCSLKRLFLSLFSHWVLGTKKQINQKRHWCEIRTISPTDDLPPWATVTYAPPLPRFNTNLTGTPTHWNPGSWQDEPLSSPWKSHTGLFHNPVVQIQKLCSISTVQCREGQKHWAEGASTITVFTGMLFAVF